MSTQKCSECSAELPAGRPVHCTRGTKAVPVGLRIKTPHHGRWRWICPRCDQYLGCDECAGRYASDVVCQRCRVYVDGTPAVPLTGDERRLLIEMVPHAAPERAIALSRLAFNLSIDESRVKETIQSLCEKGVVIAQIESRYYLHGGGIELEPPTLPTAFAPAGIELSLPLGDRN